MSLLPQQMADFGNRQPYFSQHSPLTPPITMFTPEQLSILKAATTSFGLFASLFSQSQKRQHPQILPSLSHSYRSSAFVRSSKNLSISKKSTSSLFRRGTCVKLADGRVQKVEGLRAADFVRAAESSGAESLLQWVEVDRISKEYPTMNSQREVANIRFLLNIYKPREVSTYPVPLMPPITFDYICNREQPFFVKFHGWSSCDPQNTHTRFGLTCRPLSVGDLCLVMVPSEIARLIPSFLQVPTSDIKTPVNLPFFNAKLRDLFLNPPSYVNITSPTESISSASITQQPLDLKKAGTKQSRGNVPEYFTAASLAESPFKSIK
ncbi:hypothetical protein Aperf_G00000005127 [Anoplocephala perfoliata]